MQEIEALGAVVCGLSVDGSERLAQFAAKYSLPFVLLSDRGGAVAARYGSLINLGLLKFARRNTFLIDPQGRVARVYLGVQPARNAADVTASLKELNRA
jgi:peroxiredoxin Q/BCP